MRDWWQKKIITSPKSTFVTQQVYCIVYRGAGKKLLTGLWTPQMHPHHRQPTPTWVTAHERCTPEALCRTCRQLSGIARILSSAVVTAYITSRRKGLFESVGLLGLSDHCESFTSWVLRDSLLSWVLRSFHLRWNALIQRKLLNDNIGSNLNAH